MNARKNLRIYQSPIVDKYTITDRFAYTPGRDTPHFGIDLVCPEGTPVFQPCNAKVILAGENDTDGIYLVTENGRGMRFSFVHLSVRKFSKLYEIVKTGDMIGNVGHTGHTPGGSHLHFGVSFMNLPLDLQAVGLHVPGSPLTFLDPEWFVNL